ncbi:MAG: hypothetical protein HPY52_17000 [Firmicutes bacterium]|nr:hypothetical protein [Bacillota bacterium]
MPAGQRDRKGDRPTSSSIIVAAVNQGTGRVGHANGWDNLRLKWRDWGGGAIVV